MRLSDETLRLKDSLAAEIRSRRQQNIQIQNLVNYVNEKFLGIVNKWQPTLDNLQISPTSEVCDLSELVHRTVQSVNKLEYQNTKLSHLFRILHKDLIDLQAKLQEEPIKNEQISFDRDTKDSMKFRTLAECILVVKISLQMKISRLEKKVNLERGIICEQIMKLDEICDRLKSKTAS
ncbi:unnamed protein product [Heterobilharzia americana]|nr:unnamed protein product [Heterobilharzia americana]